jgi:hypothetical protein
VPESEVGVKLATESDRSRYIAFLQAQALPLDVSCGPWKSTRSNEQNNLLFGVIYPPIAEAMGYEVDGDNGIHAFMCGTFFGWVDKPVPKSPRNPEGVASFPRRTTTRDENGKRDVIDKATFTKFVDMVDRIAAKAGVFVPRAAA